MSIELKPCPFCGSDSITNHDTLIGYSVGCDKCGAVAAHCATEAESISAWNTRTAIQQAESEPVWFHKHWCDGDDIFYRPDDNIPPGSVPLYTRPDPGVPMAKAWAEGYRQGIEDERISEANIGIAGFGAKVNPNRENPYANSHPAPAVAGELDPLRAYEFGQLITKYSESFNGQKWGGVYDSVDRKNLAVALDHLTEAGAMLMNISERLLRTNPAPAASVTDEQIFDVLKQIDPEAKRLPPGMSKFARAIFALRPAAVPMTMKQIEDMALQEQFLLICDGLDELTIIVEAIEAHHGITVKNEAL